MPKSKRDRAVTLSKTKKKGREHKELIVNSIRETVENYNSIYVFSFENMRNLKFKEFRDQLKPTSRFFLGSNKVMQVALGRSVADEIRPGLYKVSKIIIVFINFLPVLSAASWRYWSFSYKYVERRGRERLLGIKMATFKLHLICRWSPEDFELYREGLDESDVESA
ncbi:hypothetical protein Pint_30174 [Pistacia integerrima]|uniref:Uncharacterized protein n=1 Tax=Pistacia integerrima TaxID=434235 RepID=A0ACC0X1D7_9ROSI|nr:hypothetical protein Pint_30174 [Pistacia integerrima]